MPSSKVITARSNACVERMGGKTGVESDGVSGSRFWIQLPAAPNT